MQNNNWLPNRPTIRPTPRKYEGSGNRTLVYQVSTSYYNNKYKLNGFLFIIPEFLR